MSVNYKSYKSKYAIGDILNIIKHKGKISNVSFEEGKVYYDVHLLDSNNDVCSQLLHIDAALIDEWNG